MHLIAINGKSHDCSYFQFSSTRNKEGNTLLQPYRESLAVSLAQVFVLLNSLAMLKLDGFFNSYSIGRVILVSRPSST